MESRCFGDEKREMDGYGWHENKVWRGCSCSVLHCTSHRLPPSPPFPRAALTNMRASGKDATVVLSEPVAVTLDYALEYVSDDELVEITPESVRIRKNPMIKQRKS